VLIAEPMEKNEIISSLTLFTFSVTFLSPPPLFPLELTTLETFVFTGEVIMLWRKDVTLAKRSP
jgi:hypothetical protein